MRDAIEMWKSTKMIVLTAVIAAVYAAVLVPFKAVTIIPGFTELRPANVVPVVCSLLFGPAAAWGAAFGNLIGDFFGTMGPGSAFGFVGNFLYGYLPYRLWRALFRREDANGSLRQIPQYVLVALAASVACAMTIAPGVELLGLFPRAFKLLGIAITLNNGTVSCVLGPVLLPLLYPRVKRWGLLCRDVMEEDDVGPGRLAVPGAVLAIVGAGGAFMLTIVPAPPGVPLLVAVAGWLIVLLVGVVLLARMQATATLGLLGVCAALVLACSPLQWALRVALPLAVLAAAAWLPRVALRRQEVSAPGTGALGGKPRDGPAVSLSGVSFAYGTAERKALRGMDLVQPQGQFLVVAGPTGAGKSTLALCLNGLIPKFVRGEFSGSVAVLGHDVGRLQVPEASELVGLVFQDFETQLFSSDVRSEAAFAMENHGVKREEMVRRVEECLRTVGLDGFEDRDPSELSGGEKQRLAIASVLGAEPDVLVLDEPTTDLDPAGRREVLAVVGELRRRGRTVIMAEHEPEEIVGADRLVVLDEGRVAFDGPPRALLSDPQKAREAGLRPPDMPELFAALGPPCLPAGRSERPLTIEEALAILRPLGLRLRAEAVAALRRADEERAAGYGEACIACRDVCFSYDGNRALQGVSLDVRQGEFVAILGRNGCGKTTLAKHLNGLLRPSEGTVTVCGLDTRTAPISELAQRAAYVFQNPDHQIFLDRVTEEVAFGLRNIGASEETQRTLVRESLEAVGLLDVGEQDPFSLTKGERQRVAVASALAFRPEVIILDEPTTGLDGTQQRSMMDLLRRLNEQGHTVIIITHSMWAAATYAHRVVILHEGRVLADGPTREVFADRAVLDRASLRQPDCVRLSTELFGEALLTPDEVALCLQSD